MFKSGDCKNDTSECSIVRNQYRNLILKIGANKDIINYKKNPAQVFTVSVGNCT